MMLVVYIPFGVPAVGAFILDRPRSVFWVGIATVVASIAAMFGLIFLAAYFSSSGTIVTGSDPISAALILTMMAGIFLTIIPRSLAAFERTKKSAAAPKPELLLQRSFDGTREAWTAILTVVRNLAPFAQLVGPWIVLLWAVPFIGLRIAAIVHGGALSLAALPAGTIDTATEQLGEHFPARLTSAFAYPIALVGWHRFIHDGTIRTFGFGASIGILARYLWRLWMIVALIGILIALVLLNAPDVARLLGASNRVLVTTLLFWGVLCGGTYVGSSFALVLPAVAAGNRDFLGTDSLRIAKPLGNSFRIGFMASLLPSGLAWYFSADLLDGISPQSSLASYSLKLVPTALLFLALVSCATYLSRVYIAHQSPEHQSAVEEA